MIAEEEDASTPLDDVGGDEFEQGFGESLARVLDLDSWTVGADLGAIYKRVNEEVRAAVDREEEACAQIRRVIFPRLADYAGAPRGAGVYRVDTAHVERVHRGLL